MTAVAAEPGRGEPEVQKLPIARRAMVRHMTAAATIPCFYLRTTADVTELVAARRALREARDGRVPSLNDFVVRAVALELRAHPEVNSAWAEGTVEVFPRVNVGVAVAVKAGLVVPAIYDTDEKDANEIAAASLELAELAASRRLGRDLLADATFTVSNLGMYGIEDFDPVLNPPQAGILAVGAAIAGEDAKQRMRLTLGCDHRVLTGAEGAPFLSGIREQLQTPQELLSGTESEAPVAAAD